METSLMPSCFSPIQRYAVLATLALFGPSILAAEPSQSLAEKRLSIFRGTTPGIVIFDFDQAPRGAASAPRNASQAAGTGSAADAKKPEDAPAEPILGSRFLSTLPAPIGRSLQSARRLDAPDQGIAVPTARSASPPQVEAAKR